MGEEDRVEARADCCHREGEADGDAAADMRHRAAEAIAQAGRQHLQISSMLFGPIVMKITMANTTKANRIWCENGIAQAILARGCGRFASTMMAMPPITLIMPASLKGPNFSPNRMLEAPAPTKGTSSAKGTTCAAG
jgi:hypothetical protein